MLCEEYLLLFRNFLQIRNFLQMFVIFSFFFYLHTCVHQPHVHACKLPDSDQTATPNSSCETTMSPLQRAGNRACPVLPETPIMGTVRRKETIPFCLLFQARPHVCVSLAVRESTRFTRWMCRVVLSSSTWSEPSSRRSTYSHSTRWLSRLSPHHCVVMYEELKRNYSAKSSGVTKYGVEE